jgi:hypothetical protein
MARKTNDGSLDEEDFRKITEYYGFGVPAIVGEGFCTLRGKKMSKRERLANSYQGALTGLYDDFFDKTGISKDCILAMMKDPAAYQAHTSLEKLFVHFLSKVHDNLPEPNNFGAAFMKVYEAQMASEKQAGDELNFDQIQQATFDKGGYSLLFYRSVFEGLPADNEASAIFKAGALMQMGNDIFDVWKDAPEQIRTMATTCGRIDNIRKTFSQQLKETIHAFRQTGFHKKNVKTYTQKLLLGISRCFVCMDQLEMLQPTTNGIFAPVVYTRDEMLCDMEKTGNLLRAIKYYLNYPL